MIFYYLLIFTLPLSEHPFWGGGAQAKFTPMKYVGAICFMYALFQIATGRSRPKFTQTWQGRWFLVFMASALISGILGYDPEYVGYYPVISFLSYLMMFLVTVTLIDSWERLRWVLLVSVGSVGFASLYVIRQWQQYHNVWHGFRPGGVSGDSNYFTLAVMLSLPLALCLLQEGRTRWVRWLCLACLLAMLPAVGFASSRGGFLGISASMLYLIWRSKKRVRNLILIAATVIPAMTMLPNSPVKRLLHPNYSDKFGEDARRVAWLGGFRMIQQHPVFGIGLGNFRSSVESYEEGPMKVQSLAHNTYIEIAAELGLPTLFVFLAMLAASFISAERMRRWAIRSAAPPFICSAVLSVQASIIACVIGIAFLSAEYQKVVWFTIFLSVSLHSLAAATKVLEVRRGAHEGQLGAATAIPEEIYVS